MAGRVQVKIELKGFNAMARTLKTLGDPSMPYLRPAMGEIAQVFASETRTRAPGRIGSGVGVRAVAGVGAKLRAPIAVKHPGAKPLEFGRVMFYAGYKGNRGKGVQKASGRRVRRPGVRMQAFIGIKTGGGAVAVTLPRARDIISRALVQEFQHLSSGSDS